VSSILDALERIEATGGPQPSGGGPPGRGPRRRWRVILFFVSAIVVGAGAATLFLRPATPGGETTAAKPPMRVAQVPSPIPLPTPIPSPSATLPDVTPTSSTLEPSQPPIAAAPRGAAPVPPPKGGTNTERPWAWDAEPAAPPAESPPVLAVARANPPEAATKPYVPPAPPPSPAPAPHVTRDEPPDELPGPRGGNAPMGAPRLRVSFLVYSAVVERRSVALTIDGGGLTTLREGDEAQGIQVVRIRPDRVDLRWQGETFTLEVRS